MAFTFTSDEAGRSRIVLTDEPDYIVPLKIAPSSLEDVLKQGSWLVITMSVWSVYDIRAGHRAIELAKRYSGRFSLGLRPFDYPAEFIPWLPGVGLDQVQDQAQISLVNEIGTRHVLIQGNRNASPVWAVFYEGKVEATAFGCLTDDELMQLVSPFISTSR